MENKFVCKAKDSSGYCKMWLRKCVGAENCKQGYCAYCINGAISPKEDSICKSCTQFEWKKENYIE